MSKTKWVLIGTIAALAVAQAASSASGAGILFQATFRASGTGSSDRSGMSKLRDIISVKDFGATGDGTTDDTTAIQSAITAGAGGLVYFPAPTTYYKVTGTLTVSTAGTTLRGNNARIFMSHTDSLPVGGILFSVTASNIDIDGLWIDSTGTTTTAATINHYPIKIIGSSGTHLTNIRVRNCRLTALPWIYYPPSGVGSPFGTHAIYAQYVDGITVQNNKVDTVGGAAVFLTVVTKANVLDNDINGTGWYSIHLNDQVDGALIRGNRITGSGATDRMWGGSVNLMSNSTTGGACGTVGCARIKRVEIDHNYISGAHSYTAAVHIESSSYVSFHHNIMESITLTQPSDFYANPTPADFIRVYVRPAAGVTNEGINDHIDISDNVMIASGISNIAVYADAQDNGSGTLAYSDTLIVSRNRIVSVDTNNYHAKAVIVSGQQGGWKNIAITNNQISGFPDSGSPVTGLVGLISTSTVPNLDVQITGNNLTLVGGVASTTTHLGISIDAYNTRVNVAGNFLGSFWNGIRTFANSSTVILGQNSFNASGSSDYTFGVAPTPGIGTVPRYGTLFLTGRGSNLAATSVVSLAAVGEYRICATARTSTSGTGTTATLNLIWTDEGGVKTDLVGTWALNAVDVTGQINKCEYIHAAASTNIQVSVTAGTYGTSLYAISATAEKIN